MKIGFIGTGSWATALAQVLCDNGHDVLLYGISQEEVNDINDNHQNSRFFKDVALSEKIKATDQMNDIIDREVLLLGIPSKAMESVLLDLKQRLDHPVYIINVAKGFHPVSKERLSVVIKRNLEGHLKGVISLIGPSHAEEVILRKLTVINSVSDDLEAARMVQELFANDYFRVYTNTDVVGAELAAALKNIMAIASGVLCGIGEGDNARAALITRGLHEMLRFGLYFKANSETFYGLNGVGDLVVTASSIHSRNFKAGEMIGKDGSAQRFMKENKTTTEGVGACKVVYEIAKENGIEMPITNEIYNVLFLNKDPKAAIVDLMSRPLKHEY